MYFSLTRGKENRFIRNFTSHFSVSMAGISDGNTCMPHCPLQESEIKLRQPAPFCPAWVRDGRVRNKFQDGKPGKGRGHWILLLHNSLCLAIVDIFVAQRDGVHRNSGITDYEVIFSFGTHTWLSAAIASIQNLETGWQKFGPEESVSGWIS